MNENVSSCTDTELEATSRAVASVWKEITQLGLIVRESGEICRFHMTHEDDSDVSVLRKKLRLPYPASITAPFHYSVSPCGDQMVDFQHELGDWNSLPTSVPSGSSRQMTLNN